ncbi:hypothetical protein NO134_21780 [Ochrobactrum sp. BD22]
MNWLTTIAKELFGLFVDDWGFAVAIIVWPAIVWVLSGYIHHSGWDGVVLFGGLALILIGSAARRARH